MTLDIISGRAELFIVILAFVISTWAFVDAAGMFHFFWRMSGWAPWRSTVPPRFSRRLLVFLKWDAGFVAVCTGLVLLAHLFHW